MRKSQDFQWSAEIKLSNVGYKPEKQDSRKVGKPIQVETSDHQVKHSQLKRLDLTIKPTLAPD
jgi:hypothetical protein